MFRVIKEGNFREVRRMVQKKPDLLNDTSFSRLQNSPLMLALESKQEDIAQWLIVKGAELDLIRNSYGYAAIHYAAANGLVKCLQFLLEHGAEANPQENHGLTPMMLTCTSPDEGFYSEGNLLQCLKILWIWGGDPNLKAFGTGQTALEIATHFNRADAMEFLNFVTADSNEVRDTLLDDLKLSRALVASCFTNGILTRAACAGLTEGDLKQLGMKKRKDRKKYLRFFKIDGRRSSGSVVEIVKTARRGSFLGYKYDAFLISMESDSDSETVSRVAFLLKEKRLKIRMQKKSHQVNRLAIDNSKKVVILLTQDLLEMCNSWAKSENENFAARDALMEAINTCGTKNMIIVGLEESVLNQTNWKEGLMRESFLFHDIINLSDASMIDYYMPALLFKIRNG